MYNLVNLDPLRANFIGFNDIFDEMDKFARGAFKETTWPPYDLFTKKVVDGSIEEKHTFLRLAIAGIKKENLSVKFDNQNHTLEISSKKQEEDDKSVEYLHNGIARRTFSFVRTMHPDLELVKASTSIEPGCLVVEFREKSKVAKNDLIEIE